MASGSGSDRTPQHAGLLEPGVFGSAPNGVDHQLTGGMWAPRDREMLRYAERYRAEPFGFPGELDAGEPFEQDVDRDLTVEGCEWRAKAEVCARAEGGVWLPQEARARAPACGAAWVARPARRVTRLRCRDRAMTVRLRRMTGVNVGYGTDLHMGRQE